MPDSDRLYHIGFGRSDLGDDGVVAQRTASESIVLEQKGRAVERAIEVAVRGAERFSR